MTGMFVATTFADDSMTCAYYNYVCCTLIPKSVRQGYGFIRPEPTCLLPEKAGGFITWAIHGCHGRMKLGYI